MKTLRHFLVIGVLATLTACSFSNRNTIKIEGLNFYTSVPTSVSTIWDDGQNTYFVPKRSQRISAAFGADGLALGIQTSGSYLKVSGVHSRLIFTVGSESQSAFK